MTAEVVVRLDEVIVGLDWVLILVVEVMMRQDGMLIAQMEVG